MYSGLKILKFQDLIKLEIAKFMFSYDNCQLPPTFVNYFLKISQIHSGLICFSDKNFFYLPSYSTNRLQNQLNFEELKCGMKFLFTLKRIAAHSKILLGNTNNTFYNCMNDGLYFIFYLIFFLSLIFIASLFALSHCYSYDT